MRPVVPTEHGREGGNRIGSVFAATRPLEVLVQSGRVHQRCVLETRGGRVERDAVRLGRAPVRALVDRRPEYQRGSVVSVGVARVELVQDHARAHERHEREGRGRVEVDQVGVRFYTTLRWEGLFVGFSVTFA